MQKLRTEPFNCILPYWDEDQLLTAVPEFGDTWGQEYFGFSFAAFKTKKISHFAGEGSDFVCYWEG